MIQLPDKHTPEQRLQQQKARLYTQSKEREQDLLQEIDNRLERAFYVALDNILTSRR